MLFALAAPAPADAAPPTLTILHHFSANASPVVDSNADVLAVPFDSALVQGIDGNFYCTTQGGGTLGYGSVLRITPAGAVTTF